MQGSRPHGRADRNRSSGRRALPMRASRPHGRADRNRRRTTSPRFAPVASSRARGSKHVTPCDDAMRPGRVLTGARIETAACRRSAGPARSRPHGRADRNSCVAVQLVSNNGRVLTGARIETATRRLQVRCRASRPHGRADRNGYRVRPFGVVYRRVLTGARIETFRTGPGAPVAPGRVLTGARIETSPDVRRRARDGVASSRARGSKQCRHDRRLHARRRVLTGARIETSERACSCIRAGVASSRARGSKLPSLCLRPGLARRVLTGARIETLRPHRPSDGFSSRPHGRADRNFEYDVMSPNGAVASSRARGSKQPVAFDRRRRHRVASSRARGSKPRTCSALADGLLVASSRARGSKLPSAIKGRTE